MSFPLPPEVFRALETPAPKRMDASNQRIERVEADLLSLPQVECPLEHIFQPGCYIRKITMPSGALIIGHEHLTEHANIVLRGKAHVMIDGQMETLTAPKIFISKPGVRKVLLIEEEMEWATIHPTTETDLKILEKQLIKHSESFDRYMTDVRQLQNLKKGELPCPGSP